MRHFVRLQVIATTMLLVLFALSRPASADTETVINCANCNGYTFQASLTPSGSGNYSLSYTIAPNQSLTFSFNFTCANCTQLSSFDFLSSGKCVSNTNANCYAPSAN